MIESKAFCPKCKQEVVFVRTGRLSTCSSCGFQYELGGAAPPGREPGGVEQFFRLLVKAILIMAALAVIGVAVLFAGCALAFR